MDWLLHFWESLTWSEIGVGIFLFVLSIVISYGAIMIVMVKIPANYFSSQYASRFHSDKRFFVRWGAIISKNVLGVILVLVGIVFSIPGMPGPGLITILLGLVMIDIPGKRPLEAKLIKHPAVLGAVNNLRARYNKPPLIMD